MLASDGQALGEAQARSTTVDKNAVVCSSAFTFHIIDRLSTPKSVPKSVFVVQFQQATFTESWYRWRIPVPPRFRLPQLTASAELVWVYIAQRKIMPHMEAAAVLARERTSVHNHRTPAL